jgi:beta-galactosidase
MKEPRQYMTHLDPTVLLGSAYYVNTEDTPQQVRAGIAAMAQAGLKLVRIFLQWTHVEPRKGQWDWSQYDAVFETAAAGGMGVVVTLTALNPPGWMRITSGPQDIGPLDDPSYWEQAKDYIRRTCERYSHHHSLHSWILSNEPELFPAQDQSNLERFQKFMEQRYAGDINALNRRSYQQLNSFDQIAFTGNGTGGGFSGYTERMDWLDFVDTRLREILSDIKAVIRASGDTHPVHVNPHALLHDMYPRGQSIWSEGRLVDFIGCSAHPSWHSTRFLADRMHQSVALFADLMRGATRAPRRYFWVSELQGGTNIFSGLNYLGPSGQDLRSWVWESLGAGAKAVIFWCFNARTQGFEAGEWGLVDQQGRPSPRLLEVSSIAAFLHQHRGTFALSQPARARIALLFSEATWKLGSLEGQGLDPELPRNKQMGADALAGAWMACADAGHSVDILDEMDLQNGLALEYPLLILPGCTALEDASLPALQAYVENGGTLLADGLCGYKDRNGWLRLPAQNPLNALFHTSLADIQAVPEEKTTTTLGGLDLPVWFLKLVMEPAADARCLASFDQAGARPALTSAQTGRGRAVRLGTVFFQHYLRHPDPPAFSRLLALLPLPEQPLKLLNPAPTLRLRRLDLPDGALWILLNGGGPAQAILQVAPGIRLARLTQSGEEPLACPDDTLSLAVPAQAALVLRMLLN